MKIGYDPDLPEENYHAITYKEDGVISSSFLKTCLKGPVAVKWEMENPRVSNRSLELGSLVHEKLLQPDIFKAKYVFIDKPGRRNTKAYNESMAKVAADNPGMAILFKEDLLKVLAITNNVPNDILERLENSQSEASLFLDFDSRYHKCRFDSINHNAKVIYDLKTTSKFDAFKYEVKRYKYDLQAYTYLLMAGLQWDQDYDYIWLVAETVPPYRFDWFRAEDCLAEGENNYDTALVMLKEMEENNFQFILEPPVSL
jgi:hypothetical protein